MMSRHARDGRLDLILLRLARREPVRSVPEAFLSEAGLSGDHAPAGKRAVTLVQAEHLQVIAALLGRDGVDPADLRRNLIVSGINLSSLRKSEIAIGSALLAIEGPCPPCSRMEETFGPGGYNAVRNHGGFYASVVTPGVIRTGELVRPA